MLKTITKWSELNSHGFTPVQGICGDTQCLDYCADFGGQKFCFGYLCSYILWVRMPTLTKVDTEIPNDNLCKESCSYPEVHEQVPELTQLYKQKFRSNWSLAICLHFLPDAFLYAFHHEGSNAFSNGWGIS